MEPKFIHNIWIVTIIVQSPGRACPIFFQVDAAGYVGGTVWLSSFSMTSSLIPFEKKCIDATFKRVSGYWQRRSSERGTVKDVSVSGPPHDPEAMSPKLGALCTRCLSRHSRFIVSQSNCYSQNRSTCSSLLVCALLAEWWVAHLKADPVWPLKQLTGNIHLHQLKVSKAIQELDVIVVSR